MCDFKTLNNKQGDPFFINTKYLKNVYTQAQDIKYTKSAQTLAQNPKII